MKSAQEISAPLIQKEAEQHDASGSGTSQYEEENSPIEQVALTVPATDDRTLPAATFRMWTLGTLVCAFLSFLNQFFFFRREPVLLLPPRTSLDHLHLLPDCGGAARPPHGGDAHGASVSQGAKVGIQVESGPVQREGARAHRERRPGIRSPDSRRHSRQGFLQAEHDVLRGPPAAAMWWPQNLVQVSLFRALHEKEERPKGGGLTRNQFFLVAFACSFAYYVFPGYLFPMLTSFSWLCWIFPKSILAHQLGSGLHGLGIGALGIDWSSISSYLGSPLASPWFATANVALGFMLMTYVIAPVAYWLDMFNFKTFPIFSDGLFTSTGQNYNITSIIGDNFHIDFQAYDREGPLYLSTFLALTYALSLPASLPALFMF